ncbi:MAG: endopeptidase La, partial [Myxococcales bacterium]|nr:endopeptidase La [Myxococcales bacterium]
MSQHTASPPSGQYPVLPLRTEVQLPGHTAPLEIGREASVRAIEAASRDDNLIVVVPQINPSIREPQHRDLLEVGVLAELVQVVKHSPGRFTAVMKFKERVRVDAVVASDPFLIATVSPLARDTKARPEQLSGLIRTAREYLAAVVADAQAAPEEREGDKDKKKGGERPKDDKARMREQAPSPAQLRAMTDPDAIVDAAVPFLELERDDLVQLLIQADPADRLERILPQLERRATVLKLSADIGAQLEGESARHHREKVLRDRMRQIQEELGEADENAELDELRDKVDESKMPDEVRAAARKQLSRMSQMQSASPEYTIARTYVENLTEIPWGIQTDDTLDVAAARAILEAEHAGLEKVKKRILEFIAVRKLAPDKHGPILLLVGPPGVGKTSLGRSVAAALGRKYIRASLGGVRDEAEIRGHRRTYIGALPGRIISSLKKAGSMNPVFILDEIDKLASDMRGDPAAALLEVLDPEQNSDFVDHYVEVPVDLSKVMFIATANQIDSIPGPLFDRMEMIEIPGYTAREKLAIARLHLLPKQLAEHGIAKDQLEIDDEIITAVIHGWTREAGVRNLERELAGLCRSAAVDIAERHGTDRSDPVRIDAARLTEILGPQKFESDVAERRPQVGVVTGLAWTPTGGDVMFIEVRVLPSNRASGDLRLTGQLGDVMRESAAAAMTWVRSNAARLGIDHDRILGSDIHVHLPQGGVKKDGPSAGVALTCAIVSALTGRPIRNDVAITGETDLRGRAMPVGGIKEKVLAAHRAGIKVVFLPERNRKDTLDIPAEVKEELDLRFMTRIDDALEVALGEPPPAGESVPPMPPPP